MVFLYRGSYCYIKLSNQQLWEEISQIALYYTGPVPIMFIFKTLQHLAWHLHTYSTQLWL